MKHNRQLIWHECLRVAQYYAPRGRPRLLMMGESISQRYLAANDQLIGILGEAGTGKSSVVSGMFPGLELTNDDSGVNVRPCPLLRMYADGKFTAHSFHIDVRFESAFTQLHEIALAVRAGLHEGCRIIIEHFDVIYPILKINAQCLVGIGEEIIVTRPNVFGPFPEDICKSIEGTAIYRKMAHSAEDITSMILEKEFGVAHPEWHSDVPRGFVIEFESKPPNLDLDYLEHKVKDIINQGVGIAFHDNTHITINNSVYGCTGPRLHVDNSSKIKNFKILKDLIFDEITGRYCIVGTVAEQKPIQIQRNPEKKAKRLKKGI